MSFTALSPVPPDALHEIEKELVRQPIGVNKYRKKAGEGRSMAFGMVNRRSLAPDLSRNCWMRPQLYKMLLDFGQRYVPLQGWNSITVNQDYAAAPHRDKGNTGLSYLVAFGEYQGGELQVHGSDASGVYGIRYSPILFDGAALEHSVLPFTGHRYSLVYYTLAESPQTPFEQYVPEQDEQGRWVVSQYVDGKRIRILKRGQGLPHPLQGRKRNT